MVFIRVDGHEVAVCFPIVEDGLVTVTALTLSLRFQFREDSIFVEEEIVDLDSSKVTHAVGYLCISIDEGKVWLLKAGKYRAYGLSHSLLDASTKVLTPQLTSTASIQTPILSRVKVEPGLEMIYELSDDFGDDASLICKLHLHCSYNSSSALQILDQKSSSVSRPSGAQQSPTFVASSLVILVQCLQCLKKFGPRKRSKNIQSQNDYDTIQVLQVEFLPPLYDVEIIFEFPLLGFHGKQRAARQLQGMDKRYDGHAWSRQTL